MSREQNIATAWNRGSPGPGEGFTATAWGEKAKFRTLQGPSPLCQGLLPWAHRVPKPSGSDSPKNEASSPKINTRSKAMERSPRIIGEAVQSPAGAQHGPEELEPSPLGPLGWLFNKTALLAGSMKGLGSTLPLSPPLSGAQAVWGHRGTPQSCPEPTGGLKGTRGKDGVRLPHKTA